MLFNLTENQWDVRRSIPNTTIIIINGEYWIHTVIHQYTMSECITQTLLSPFFYFFTLRTIIYSNTKFKIAFPHLFIWIKSSCSCFMKINIHIYIYWFITIENFGNHYGLPYKLLYVSTKINGLSCKWTDWFHCYNFHLGLRSFERYCLATSRLAETAGQLVSL